MRLTIDINVIDAFEEGAHPRGPGGEFTKAHELAEKHGFKYEGYRERIVGKHHAAHMWSHSSGASMTLSRSGGLGRASGAHVATVHMGPNTSRSDSDPVWAHSAVRRAIKKSGVTK